MNIIDRFYKFIDVKEKDECWEWQGYRDKDGYGYFSIGGKPILAHRFMWEMEYDEIQEGIIICHTCDNPPCVNPNHLWEGNRKSNLEDMVEKGRSNRGELNNMVKLTELDVIYIRQLHQNGIALNSIANIVGTHPSNVSLIVRRKTWKHIP
jgi:hypothetical protein